MTCMLQHFFTAVVAGPTGCGKSQFVLHLIDNALEMIEPPPTRIWYCYGEYQPTFNNYPNVRFHEGLPESSDVVFDWMEATLLVLDNLVFETNELVANTSTKLSHHRNVSVIHLTQNLFDKNKYTRTISLNAHYLVLFKIREMLLSMLP